MVRWKDLPRTDGCYTLCVPQPSGGALYGPVRISLDDPSDPGGAFVYLIGEGDITPS